MSKNQQGYVVLQFTALPFYTVALHIKTKQIFHANYLATGILAIAKPCAIVVSVKELFGAESKTQVYAHLHEQLQKPEMHDIGKFHTAIKPSPYSNYPIAYF